MAADPTSDTKTNGSPVEDSDANRPTTTTTPTTPSKPAYPTTLAELTIHSPTDDQSTSTSSHRSSIYKTLSHLRKSTLSIPNRLTSVLQDAEFVESLWRHLNDHSSLSHSHSHAPAPTKDGTWPLIPNERSGTWPLDPSVKMTSQESYLPKSPSPSHPSSRPPSPPHSPTTESESAPRPRRQSSQHHNHNPHPVSAYFKSTDGHTTQWSFSLRRLNLHLLHILGSAHGAVLIDTTRRGKTYPDALRRTVPIWTCVWNRVLFPEEGSEVCNEFQAFGLDESEKTQIEDRLERFVGECKGLGLDLAELRRRVGRPVRCVWVSQPISTEEWEGTSRRLAAQISSEREKLAGAGVDVNVLVCCSASKVVAGAEMSEEGYIQGAGDDGEGWARGLTARVFWANKEELMSAVQSGKDVEGLVDRLVTEDKYRSSYGPGHSVLVAPTRNLYVGFGEGILVDHDFNLVIDVNALNDEPQLKLLGMRCKEGKLGSKMMRERLPQIAARAEKQLRTWPEKKILVKCSTGKDLSVGVVLVILCCFYADDGQVSFPQTHTIDKQFIKQRLAWITSSKPEANPSRATLQAVNSFLIGRPD